VNKVRGRRLKDFCIQRKRVPSISGMFVELFMQIKLDADLSRSSKNNNSVTDVESQRFFVYVAKC